jgi:hypothetical protein
MTFASGIGTPAAPAHVCQKENVMTKTTLALLVNRTTALSCVWFIAANPARPPSCKWIALDELDAGPRPSRFTGLVL